MKTIRKLMSIFLITTLLLPTVLSGTQATNGDTVTVSGNILSNEYLELAVDASTGRFSIGTSGGNPDIETDNNKKMLYGHPNPGTSYTTIVVDGEVNRYGDSGFTSEPVFDQDQKQNVSIEKIGDIEIKQTLQIVNNNSTDREDVVEIKYEVTNTGASSHTVGTRIMLDTMLGSNDAAPFRIPGVGDVSTQTEFSGADIPQYWQAFDSFTNTKVVAQGSFLRSDANQPDKVQFTNWGKVSSTPWEAPVTPGSGNGDSAVTVTWNEKNLAAGESRVYTTHYGMSELVQDLLPPLAISVYGDSAIRVADDGTYSPNPIQVTAYIKNISSATARNVHVTLAAMNGLKLKDGEPAEYRYETLAPNEEKQISWYVNVLPQSTDNLGGLIVLIGADGVEDKRVEKMIRIPATTSSNQDNRIKWGSENGSGEWSGEDNLGFTNSKDNFISKGWLGFGDYKEDYYHLSDDYFRLLTDGMSNTVWSYVNTKRTSPWGGSCYGMSAVVSLMKDGRLTPSYWQSGAKKTHDLKAPKKSESIETLINFYQLQCCLPDWQDWSSNATIRPGYQKDVLKQLVDEAGKVKNGGLPVVASFYWTSTAVDENGNHKSGGHAVVAYDVDTGSYQENNKNFRYRLSICDPNHTEWTYLYVTEAFDDWYYEDLSTTADSNQQNAWNVLVENGVEQKFLYMAISEINTVDLINPETGVRHTILKNYNRNFLDDYTGASLSISNGSQTAQINGNSSSGDLDVSVVPANFGVTVEGETSNQRTVFLPDATAYTVTPDQPDAKMKNSMVFENAMLTGATDAGKSIIFDPVGKVIVTGNNSNYEMSLTLNDGYTVMPWFYLEAIGNQANESALERTDEGVLLTSDNLSNTLVTGNSRTQSVSLTVQTEEHAVLLRAIDETTLGAFADTDKDGTYETLIATSDSESARAQLMDLQIEDVTLNPSFASDVTEYTATVANTVSSITLTASLFENTRAIISVNSGEAEALFDTQRLNLEIGENVIHIVVTSEEALKTEYTIVVTRMDAEPDSTSPVESEPDEHVTGSTATTPVTEMATEITTTETTVNPGTGERTSLIASVVLAVAAGTAILFTRKKKEV